MKLFRSSTPFVLMSTVQSPSYKLKILDVSFKTARVKVDPAIILNHRQQTKETPAIYLMNESHVTQNVIPKGSTEFYWNSIFLRTLPNTVVFGLISQKAANGDYTENPFNFQHFNLTEVTLTFVKSTEHL